MTIDEPKTEPAAPTYLDEGSRWQRTAGWVSVGIAAVALTTGAVLAESAASRAQDMDRLQKWRDPSTQLPATYTGNVQQAYEDARSEGKSLQTWSRVALIGAGVATVAAIIFFIVDPGAAAAPEGNADRGHHLVFAPTVSKDGVGVTAAWGF